MYANRYLIHKVCITAVQCSKAQAQRLENLYFGPTLQVALPRLPFWLVCYIILSHNVLMS